MVARHINPVESERTATAPYNFVPLPNRIYSVEDGIEVSGQKVQLWKIHDQHVSGSRNGWIELTIKTLTPLFIRGPITKIGEAWGNRDSRLRPEPYVNKDGVPVIPGSSIRGMIRSIVEVLSFSKISPVTDERPFFRSVSDERIGKAYRKRMIHGILKPQGGYVKKNDNKWVITPAIEVLRVHRDKLNKLGLKVSERPRPDYYPDWKGQQQTCWFRRNSEKKWLVDEVLLKDENGLEKGILVLTGSAPKKDYDFVFVGEDPAKSIVVPENILRRFHDDDQLTQWQEKAFPKDKPFKDCRKSKGYLRNGEPIFFLEKDSEKKAENPGGLVFFGRAQMFRFPYDLSPKDLIPEELKNAGLDLAEALFGMVGKETIKGRVFFEDVIAEGEKSDWFEDIIMPRILASPKVTCFQHYLTQDGTKSREELTTYLIGDQTTVRGHKHYWHRWDDDNQLGAVKEKIQYDERLNELQLPKPHDSQHTLIQPVKDQVEFSGRIRFHNLSDIELGALLAALELPEGCAHKLGMGKPLGLGSIRIHTELFFVDREVRYKSWENTGVNAQDVHVFIDAFEKQIITHARNTHETLDESSQGLWKIARLQALFYLLSWYAKPPISDTEYMKLEQFKDKERRVLPTPHGVKKQPEPPWQADPPRKAEQSSGATKTRSCPASTADMLITKRVFALKEVAPKDILKGQKRTGFFRRRGENWVAVFKEDSREAVIVNKDNIPEGVDDSVLAEFYIMEQSKKTGIKVRFENLIEKK